MYAAEAIASNGASFGTEPSIAMTPVATTSSTATVPRMIPQAYRSEPRKPKAAPIAVTLIVAGPGLPMTTGGKDKREQLSPKFRLGKKRFGHLTPSVLPRAKRRYGKAAGSVLNDRAWRAPEGFSRSPCRVRPYRPG